jgi:hypothetical protein
MWIGLLGKLCAIAAPVVIAKHNSSAIRLMYVITQVYLI